ncbi:MAG: hypothetical protein J6Y59_10735 [Bacteroidaceae bacterium]|nr:hypothetical protein [Bacteroidaceae bacterium]
MKKTFLLLACMLLTAASATAQSYYRVHKADGEIVKYEASEVSHIDFQVVKTVQPVDLGLPSGTLWSPVNLGAETEEEYGEYFAWAEPQTKELFTTNNYAYYVDGNTWNVIDIGTTDIAGMEAYDAATAQWGNGWQMPTLEQFNELMEKCTVEWETVNEMNGRRFTGPNGNSIFIPAAGRHYQKTMDEESSKLLDNGNTYGYYWSSTRYEYNNRNAETFYFGSGMMKMNYFGREGGHTIRPVKMPQ